MRKYMLGFVIVAATITSCLKSKEPENYCDTYDPCAIKAPQSEMTAVETYLADNNITDAVKHCSGMYYKIIAEGSGTIPGVCSSVTINYKGTFTNGTVFDSTKAGSPATFIPINLITGWKDGIPLIKKGGSIQLFVPPTLGYGPADYKGIPGGSILVFDIEMVDVQP